MRRTLLEPPIIVRNVRITGPSKRISVDLVLDTGESYCMLPREILKYVGYSENDVFIPDRELVTASKIIKNAPMVKVASISFGDLTVQDVLTNCHTLPETEDSDIVGLLGWSFLRYFKLIVDLANEYYEIEHSNYHV